MLLARDGTEARNRAPRDAFMHATLSETDASKARYRTPRDDSSRRALLAERSCNERRVRCRLALSARRSPSDHCSLIEVSYCLHIYVNAYVRQWLRTSLDMYYYVTGYVRRKMYTLVTVVTSVYTHL